ncbi:MAG: hypothetical protein SPE24_09080 [Erysipelotrichaceae bacterium]|nr:hypothetical protein [Erysipelotrichaceae bacterium]
MTAKNMKELEQMLLKEMRKAMNVASERMLADMYDETGGFYTQGNPKMYQRTGALGDTPKATAVSSSGNVVSFKAYLDTSGGYTTGDNPSMTQVLDLANYGKPWTTKSGSPARATLGKKGFWERAEKKMQRTLDRTMRQFFN